MPLVLQDLHAKYKAGALKTLTPAECITQYATSLQSNRRHVLLVASDNNFPTAEQNVFVNGSHVYWAGPFSASDAQDASNAAVSYSWMCTGMVPDGYTCSNKIDSARSNPNAWRVGNYCPYGAYCGKNFPVEYCLSEPAEPHCRLQYDLTIAVVVTVLNFGTYCLTHMSMSSTFTLPSHFISRCYFDSNGKQSLA
jgi:hypothetical protein